MHDFFKFDKRDFIVGGSPTGYNVRLASPNANIPPTWTPWQVYKTDPPAGSPPNPGTFFAVNLDSWLLTDPGDLTNYITVKNNEESGDGLGDDDIAKIPVELKLYFMVWLHIDLTPLYNTMDGADKTPKAYVEYGLNGWDNAGEGTSVYPATMKWNTDDGSYLGSDGGTPPGTPPANAQQTDIFVPIGYVDSDDNDYFGLVGGNRYAFQIGPDPADPTNNLYWIQQLKTNLMFGQACASEDNNNQANFQNVIPWFASAQPDNPT